MKKLASVAVAAFAGAAMLAATIAPADAGKRHRGFHGGEFAAGAILGLAFGALATAPYHYPPPPPRYGYGSWRAHVDWCYANYYSYDEYRDTFVDHYGVERRCISPYL